VTSEFLGILTVSLSGSQFSYEADSFFNPKGNCLRIEQLILTINPGISGAGVYAKSMTTFLKELALDSGYVCQGGAALKSV
jgi:(2R)-3-sulfolactate dehydrogenase (NADP+)